MPDIIYGNREGRYFIEGHFDALAAIAEDLAKVLPDATDWRIWYDAWQDLHKLDFRINDDVYEIRYYSFFAASKNGNDSHASDSNTTTFGGRPRDLVDFFRRGSHAAW